MESPVDYVGTPDGRLKIPLQPVPEFESMSDQRYLVAARKYRPQRFDQVVSQEHVCDTLTNAVSRDRIGHAYLFSGPRGVGKTTVARILAKSINCTTPLKDRDGAEPCQQCDACTSLTEGRNLNVIEIDAASNNKVDDVRELRDTVRVPPQGARKKVYIVDEVHMLSTSAFNAFLKTLEEPPSYALFIFATTEPNKVLPTILSRCQRFDFRRIPVNETVARLESIAGEEGIEIDEASLLLIAQRGDGALRDALSVFDQAVALCGTKVTYAALADALGVVGVDLFFETTEHIRAGNSAGVLDLVRRVMSSGFDLQEFLTGLSEHIRNLLVARTMPDMTLVETSAAVKKQYEREAEHFTHPVLLRLLSIAADAEGSLRVSAQPRLQLELSLLKMVNVSNTIDLRNALAKLDQLAEGADATTSSEAAENRDEAEAIASESSRVRQRKRRPDPTPESTTEPTVSKTQNGNREKAGVVASDATTGDPQPPEAGDASDKQTRETAISPEQTGVAVERKPETEAADKIAIDAREESTPRNPGQPDDGKGTGVGVPDLFGPPALSGRTKKNGAGAGTIEGSAARSAAVETHAAIDEHGEAGAEPTKNWLPFVKAVKSERIHVGSLLQHAAPAGYAGADLVVDVPDEFHRRLLDNQQDFLVGHVRQSISVSISAIRFVVRQTVTPPEGETGEDFDPYEYMQQKRRSNPVVNAIFEEFGGELVW